MEGTVVREDWTRIEVMAYGARELKGEHILRSLRSW